MKTSFAALHLSVLLAGTTGIFGKIIRLDALILVWWRLALGGAVLLLIARLFLRLA